MKTGPELESENERLRRRIAQLEAELQHRGEAPMSAPAQMTPDEVDAVLGALPVLLFIIGSDDTYLAYRVGAGMKLFVGPEMFLGRPVLESLPRKVGTLIQAAITRARDTAVRQTVDYALRTPAGESSFSAQLLPLDSGRVAALVTDTTAQRRIEEALRESEAKFRTAFQDAGVGILLVNREGHVIDHNRAFRACLGYLEEEINGAHLGQLLHPEDAEAALADVAEMASGTRDSVIRERRYRRKDGSWCDAIIRATPLRNEAGEFQYSMAVVEDVTQKKTLEAQLLLASRMASIGTLAAGVAHEINNPLAFMVANLAFVLERVSHLDPRPDELIRALEDTSEGAVRVRDIVRDLKTFSRSEERADEMVDVRQVLRSAINLAQNEIRHRARLVLDLREVAPVEANTHRLEQVFVNLLINAAQAIAEGHADRNEIRVACHAHDDRVIVEIADTGCGIREGLLARIFDPFFTTKPVGVGMGLGLSICHSIVTGLGGTIEVESQVGQGSTFRVVLPRTRARREAATMTTASSPTASRSGRVLVVDDEPLVIRALARALAREHRVVTFTSASAALAHLDGDRAFDVILCDLMMPEMSGMDLHARLAGSNPDLSERMVFMTGGAFTPEARDFLDRVPNERIEKPFNPDALLKLLGGLKQ